MPVNDFRPLYQRYIRQKTTDLRKAALILTIFHGFFMEMHFCIGR